MYASNLSVDIHSHFDDPNLTPESIMEKAKSMGVSSDDLIDLAKHLKEENPIDTSGLEKNMPLKETNCVNLMLVIKNPDQFNFIVNQIGMFRQMTWDTFQLGKVENAIKGLSSSDFEVKTDKKTDKNLLVKVFWRGKFINDFGRATIISTDPRKAMDKVLGLLKTSLNGWKYWIEDDQSDQCKYRVVKMYIWVPGTKFGVIDQSLIVPYEVQFKHRAIYCLEKAGNLHKKYEAARLKDINPDIDDMYGSFVDPSQQPNPYDPWGMMNMMKQQQMMMMGMKDVTWALKSRDSAMKVLVDQGLISKSDYIS